MQTAPPLLAASVHAPQHSTPARPLLLLLHPPLQAARVLLRHGACPDGLRGEEEAPLLAAARMLDLEGVQLLLGAGADPGAVAWGRTALDFVLETCTDDAAVSWGWAGGRAGDRCPGAGGGRVGSAIELQSREAAWVNASP